MTLFPTRDDKQQMLEAAIWPLMAAPRAVRAIRRLIWTIETTPADSRTRELLAAKLGVTERTVSRLTRLAETAGALHTESNPGDANRYRIDWPAIARAARRPSHQQTAASQETRQTNPTTHKPAGLYAGGWPIEITRDSLRTVATVNQLYQFALARKWVTNEDREGFFALAAAIVGCRKIPNPGAAFTRRVKAKDWSVGTGPYVQQARQALQRIDAL